MFPKLIAFLLQTVGSIMYFGYDVLENYSYQDALILLKPTCRYIAADGKTAQCDEFNKNFFCKRKSLWKAGFLSFGNSLETPTNFCKS